MSSRIWENAFMKQKTREAMGAVIHRLTFWVIPVAAKPSAVLLAV